MARNKSGLYQSEAWLRKRYLTDKKSVDDMAKEANVSTVIIYKQLKKFGIKR